MKKRTLRTTAHRLGFGVLVSVLLLLAGCSKEEDPNRLPDGKYPMTFTAQVEGLTAEKAATRATVDNSWAGTEEVAVQVGSEVKKYTAAVGGTLTVHSDNEPWYWQSTTDTKTVSAWYPYSVAQPTSFSVQEDQCSAGYQSSDLIYAAPKEITYGNSSLTFKHLPVKVVVNLKNGDGVTATEVTNATVTIVNQATTSGAIAADWSVTQQTTQGTTITPNTLTSPTSGAQKSVQALLVPQKSIASTRFIKVAVGSQEFYYSTTLDFAAGQQHTYNITVLKSGITVTASGATEWTGTTSDVTSKEVTIFSASDLKIGDYYYSDGTWSDGGLRKRYVDGTFVKEDVCPVLTDASNQPRTVVGIVYWVGNPTNATNGDPLLARDKSTCTHGLVVALHEVKKPSTNTAAKMKWSISTEQVNNWTNSDDRGDNKVDITKNDKYQGYANTVALKAYNAQQGNDNYKILPIAAVEQYQTDYPAPSNSSGWYVPSIMELKQVCWGQGITSNSTTGRDLLNGQFAKAGGTNLDGSWGYWSSTESGNFSDLAFGMDFDDGDVLSYFKDYTYRVRCVLAF